MRYSLIFKQSFNYNYIMLSDKEIKKFNKLVDQNDGRLSSVFSALSDPKRCRIYRLFLNGGNKDLYVNDIAKLMDISVPSASQHLKILEMTGLLSKERHGQKTTFRVNREDPIVNALMKAVL